MFVVVGSVWCVDLLCFSAQVKLNNSSEPPQEHECSELIFLQSCISCFPNIQTTMCDIVKMLGVYLRSKSVIFLSSASLSFALSQFDYDTAGN